MLVHAAMHLMHMTTSWNSSSSKHNLPSSSDSSTVRLMRLRRRGILLSAIPIHVASAQRRTTVSLLEVLNQLSVIFSSMFGLYRKL